jgi:hypothetical protein
MPFIYHHIRSTHDDTGKKCKRGDFWATKGTIYMYMHTLIYTQCLFIYIQQYRRPKLVRDRDAGPAWDDAYCPVIHRSGCRNEWHQERWSDTHTGSFRGQNGRHHWSVHFWLRNANRSGPYRLASPPITGSSASIWYGQRPNSIVSYRSVLSANDPCQGHPIKKHKHQWNHIQPSKL